MVLPMSQLLTKSFPTKLTQIRKSQGLTQQALSRASSLHINQIRRYESGTSQPTLEGLVKLAQTLHVSLDELVFNKIESNSNERFSLLFEAIGQLNRKEQSVIHELLEGMILKYRD